MQLRGLFIFSHTGEARYIPFRIGELNIVSGAPGTGKSALLRIVDYCLGSYNRIPIEIRQVASWYGIVLTNGHDDVLLARPEPKGKQATEAMYLSIGKNLDIPQYQDLVPNASVESALDVLASYVGLASVDLVFAESSRRTEYDATIRHASRYSFQIQREIAQNEFLFHGQDDHYIAQSIHDTLPYLLGILDEERLRKHRLARRLTRRLRAMRRELESMVADDVQTPVLAQKLIAEAVDVGLLPATATYTTNFLAVLAATQSFVKAQSFSEFEDADLKQGIVELRKQRAELLTRYKQARDSTGLVRELNNEVTEFGDVQFTEESHGSAIELLAGVIDSGLCMICGRSVDSPSAEAIRNHLQDLRSELSGTRSYQVRTRNLREKYETEAESLRATLRTNQAALNGAIERSEQLNSQRSAAVAQEHVAGRISLYLEAMSQGEDRERLEAQIADLEEELSIVLAGLSDESLQRRRSAIVHDVSERMNEHGKVLKFQYAGADLEFDLDNLTVVITDAAGRKTLQQIGSASNHLAIHIAAHLGLHDFFITESRPTLRFLMLDQPTQAYYPPDKQGPTASDLSDVGDEDRDAVATLFAVLDRFNRQFMGQFQIIVVDHADLRQPQFQQSIVARWRDGDALIPRRWFMQGGKDA